MFDDDRAQPGAAGGRSCTTPPAPSPAGRISASSAVAPVAARASAQLVAVREALGLLREIDLCRLSEPELLELARDVERTVRSWFGMQIRLAGEISERGIAATLSARSAAHLLRETLAITIGDARARIAAAAIGLGSETLSGAVIDPSLPELVDAVDVGAISREHCAAITGCVGRMPDALDEETRTLCREALLREAACRDPNALRQVAEHIENIVIPDRLPPDTDPGPRAELHIGARRSDGLTPIRGLLSPLTAEQLTVAIEALAAPAPIDEATPDPRPAALRREQALGEILHRHLTRGAGPRAGGIRPQVVVTIGVAEWRGAKPGSADFDYTGTANAALAQLLSCDGRIVPQLIDNDSVVLDQGRAVRLFTADQRRAITTRDRGCAFPGCDIPPAWTEAHHITWWSRGGATDVANGVLLCRRHHTEIHQGPWQVRSGSDGRPDFIPPAHIDPNRQPRRNKHFRLLDLTNRRRH